MTAYRPAPADVLLMDGTVAVIRLVESSDGDQLHQLHENISDENLRMRFFTVGRVAAHRYVEHLLADQTLSMVVELQGHLLALATAESDGPGTAEVAFLVADDRHRQGIGSLLLEHLAATARERGIGTFTADVLVENHAMLDVFVDAGFQFTRHSSEGVVTLSLDNRLTPSGQAALDARERRAEAHSLRPLLYPRSVAVLGAAGDPGAGGFGRAALDALVAGGFTGTLVAIHPDVSSIAGVPAYPSLSDVPVPVDLVVVAVPALEVPDAVSGAADAGVPSAVILGSGFRELGEAGTELRDQLAALARERSIRVVGPDCMGVLTTRPDIGLNAAFGRIVPPAGGLAVATQSGGVGIVLGDLARLFSLGIASLISLGDKIDVSGNDLLAAWTEDPNVSAAALYLESFGNAPKFARIARRFAERKPLLAVVGGQSVGLHWAVESSADVGAPPAIGVRALFAQAGVIACDDAEDLAETALLVTAEPLPKGPRLGVVGNAGGMGVLAADAAKARGLTVPELCAGTPNPVDLRASASGVSVAASTEKLISSGEVDAVLVVLVATSLNDAAETLELLEGVRARHRDKPLLLVPHGLGASPFASALTAFRSAAAACTALRRAVQYAAWLKDGSSPQDLEASAGVANSVTVGTVVRRRQLAQRVLDAKADTGGWVGAADAADLLNEYGLTPSGAIAVGAHQVALTAQSVGFPVMIKVAEPHVLHGNQRGLVRVGLGSVDAVHTAATSFEREIGRDDVPVLVQPVVSGVELVIGLVRDPSFGPLVMVGAGGVNTDLLADRVYLLPPVHSTDVRRALRGLRCWPLLEGFRGSAPVDLDSVVQHVVAVGNLGQEVPEVAEVEVNPVVVSASGCALVDVNLRLETNVAPAPDAPRQLRARGG